MIPVDTNVFRLMGTGNVSPVLEWIETADGKRRPGDVQEVNEQGAPMWEVECLRSVEKFGKSVTESVSVRVPHASEPSIKAYAPVPFDGLSVDFFVSKGQGREAWRASGFASSASSAPAASSESGKN